MILVIPLTRAIVGTSVGTVATIVPLVIAAFPFIARLAETSLREINPKVDMNIFRSTYNVNLNTIISYTKDDKHVHFLDTYDEDKIKKTEGFGYLKFSDFKKLVDENPQIKDIELSNAGEIFLNPELDKIIKYAYEKKISLTANNGVNLNTLSDEMAEILVKYQFRTMNVSIDGATPDVYKIYRRGGDFNKVIANIKKINEYKKKYNSVFPVMVYKYIIFNHNIEDIPLAKKLAKELNMDCCFIQNTQAWYAPLSKKQIKRAEELSGINLDDKIPTPEEDLTRFLNLYREKKHPWFFCDDLFASPQINWNGNLLGCIIYLGKNFGVNVFKEGLLNALNHKNVLYAKRMLTDFSVPPKDVPRRLKLFHCSHHFFLGCQKYYSNHSVAFLSPL